MIAVFFFSAVACMEAGEGEETGESLGERLQAARERPPVSWDTDAPIDKQMVRDILLAANAQY